MSAIRDAMVALSTVTDGSYPQIRAIEEWCEDRPPTAGADYPQAAIELGKAGVPIEKILDCLEAIRWIEGTGDRLGILNSAEIVAHGAAMFGLSEPAAPLWFLQLARRAVQIAGRR